MFTIDLNIYYVQYSRWEENCCAAFLFVIMFYLMCMECIWSGEINWIYISSSKGQLRGWGEVNHCKSNTRIEQCHHSVKPIFITLNNHYRVDLKICKLWYNKCFKCWDLIKLYLLVKKDASEDLFFCTSIHCSSSWWIVLTHNSVYQQKGKTVLFPNKKMLIIDGSSLGKSCTSTVRHDGKWER